MVQYFLQWIERIDPAGAALGRSFPKVGSTARPSHPEPPAPLSYILIAASIL